MTIILSIVGVLSTFLIGYIIGSVWTSASYIAKIKGKQPMEVDGDIYIAVKMQLKN
jgi:hypothetical protein